MRSICVLMWDLLVYLKIRKQNIKTHVCSLDRSQFASAKMPSYVILLKGITQSLFVLIGSDPLRTPDKKWEVTGVRLKIAETSPQTVNPKDCVSIARACFHTKERSYVLAYVQLSWRAKFSSGIWRGREGNCVFALFVPTLVRSQTAHNWPDRGRIKDGGKFVPIPVGITHWNSYFLL